MKRQRWHYLVFLFPLTMLIDGISTLRNGYMHGNYSFYTGQEATMQGIQAIVTALIITVGLIWLFRKPSE